MADGAASGSRAADDRKGSIAGLLGYATGGGNAGLGLRGGYRVVDRVVVGGAFVYQLGESQEAAGVKVSASYFYVGPEVGYELFVGPLSVRPYVGTGVAVLRASQEAGGESESRSSSSLAIWPGATVAYEIANAPAFVGLDSRLVVATEGGDPSLAVSITGGARF